MCVHKHHKAGFYLETLFRGGGNIGDKDRKKGYNTLLCTVGAFASQLTHYVFALTPTMTSCTYHLTPTPGSLI